MHLLTQTNAYQLHLHQSGIKQPRLMQPVQSHAACKPNRDGTSMPSNALHNGSPFSTENLKRAPDGLDDHHM